MNRWLVGAPNINKDKYLEFENWKTIDSENTFSFEFKQFNIQINCGRPGVSSVDSRKTEQKIEQNK